MTELSKATSSPTDDYLNGRWQSQYSYCNKKAILCQRRYLTLRRVSLIAGVLTPIAIFVITLVVVAADDSNKWIHLWHLLPITLSAIALGGYQWEEIHDYRYQWGKFRIVAERLQRSRELFLNRVGIYGAVESEVEALKRFIEYCEGLLETTDTDYFVLVGAIRGDAMPA